MLGKGGFDFAEFDAEAAEFDLLVFAAEELDGAVGPVAAEVAGIVEPLAGERMVDEAGLGLFRIVPVADAPGRRRR